MRLLLLASLLFATSAGAQEMPRAETGLAEARSALPTTPDPAPVKPGGDGTRPVEGGEAVETAGTISSSAAAEPTFRNFVYQVLVATVTALLTALIWKAVF